MLKRFPTFCVLALALVTTASAFTPNDAVKGEGTVTYTEADFPKAVRETKQDRLPFKQAQAPAKPVRAPLWGPTRMPDTCVWDYRTPRIQLVFPGHCLT